MGLRHQALQKSVLNLRKLNRRNIPAIAVNTVAASHTLRARIPTVSCHSLTEYTPCLEVRPTVGFMLTTADLWAGELKLPDVLKVG